MRLDLAHRVAAVGIADTADSAVLDLVLADAAVPVAADMVVAVAAVAAAVVAAAAFCSGQLCCSIGHYCCLRTEIADHRHLLQHHCYPDRVCYQFRV